MIKPHKYLDLDSCVIFVSSVILKRLRETSVAKYDELVEWVGTSHGEKAQYNLSSALGFLFILGKIEYHSDIDSIEYVP